MRIEARSLRKLKDVYREMRNSYLLTQISPSRIEPLIRQNRHMQIGGRGLQEIVLKAQGILVNSYVPSQTAFAHFETEELPDDEYHVMAPSRRLWSQLI